MEEALQIFKKLFVSIIIGLTLGAMSFFALKARYESFSQSVRNSQLRGVEFYFHILSIYILTGFLAVIFGSVLILGLPRQSPTTAPLQPVQPSSKIPTTPAQPSAKSPVRPSPRTPAQSPSSLIKPPVLNTHGDFYFTVVLTILVTGLIRFLSVVWHNGVTNGLILWSQVGISVLIMAFFYNEYHILAPFDIRMTLNRLTGEQKEFQIVTLSLMLGSLAVMILIETVLLMHEYFGLFSSWLLSKIKTQP